MSLPCRGSRIPSQGAYSCLVCAKGWPWNTNELREALGSGLTR